MKKVISKNLIALMIVLILAILGILALGIKEEKTLIIQKGNRDSVLMNDETIVGKVTVKCVDKEGKYLKEDEVLTGAVGTEYSIKRPEISSYIAYGNDPINKIGNYDLNDVEVIFIYQKEEGNVNIINKDNVIKVQIMNNQNKEIKEIVARIITKSEDGENLNGAKYIITDSNNAVIRNATSNTDNLIVGSFQITEEGADKYVVKQIDVPEGYEKLKEPIEFKIVKVVNEDGEYVISLEYDEMEGVKISIEEEITIEITNKKVEISEEKPEEKPEEEPEEKPEEKPAERPQEKEETDKVEEKPIEESNKDTGDNIIYIIFVLATAGVILFVSCMVMVRKNN